MCTAPSKCLRHQARYALDEDDLFAQIRWCKEHPADAAAMAQRAMETALQAFTDEAVDTQAMRALLLRASERQLSNEQASELLISGSDPDMEPEW